MIAPRATGARAVPYSDRIATIGLTAAARQAGIQAATTETPPSSRPTVTNVTGSSAGLGVEGHGRSRRRLQSERPCESRRRPGNPRLSCGRVERSVGCCFMRHGSRLRFILEGIESVAVLGAVLCTWPLSKRWLENWGSTVGERERSWPGDQFVSPDHGTSTRAIDIDASADAVWRWIVQFGMDRAGFYSYELLERIVGIPVTNVESIEETMQSLAVGDEVRLHPKAPGIPVAEIRPGRYVCFGARNDANLIASEPDPGRSWSMYVESTSAGSCRLLVRSCIESPRQFSRLQRSGMALEESIDFVMEQRMLRTIKRLAEEASD